ncbi:hypothetical protein J6590_089336 [Homalodisca vitripennis]|nr:hypothetical protein J6590_089336 [Homalodisca vitripennis]
MASATANTRLTHGHNKNTWFTAHYVKQQNVARSKGSSSTFNVIIPECQEWQQCGPSFERGAQIWYTDGSRKDEGM